MDARAAERTFKEADERFREGNYIPALRLLEKLERSFPEERRVLFAKARCLAEMRRVDEAVALCDRLIQEHDYDKAVALKEQLRLPPKPASFNFEIPEIELRPKIPPAEPASSLANGLFWGGIALAAILFVGAVIIALLILLDVLLAPSAALLLTTG